MATRSASVTEKNRRPFFLTAGAQLPVPLAPAPAPPNTHQGRGPGPHHRHPATRYATIGDHMSRCPCVSCLTGRGRCAWPRPASPPPALLLALAAALALVWQNLGLVALAVALVALAVGLAGG